MRREISRLTVLSTFVLSLAACEEITEFPEGGVDVRAAHALPAVRTAAIDFTVNIAVDNWTASLLWVDPNCGFVIERMTGGDWAPAYQAPCETSFAAEVQVDPQTTHIFTISALAALRVVATDPPAGTYRVVVPIEAEYSRLRRQTVPVEDRTSNAFVVP